MRNVPTVLTAAQPSAGVTDDRPGKEEEGDD